MNKNRFYNQEHESQDPATVHLECYWEDKSKTKVFFDSPILLINLDQLNPDANIRRIQLFEIVTNAYEEAKITFESSPEYGNRVKNGTYTREFIVTDPIDEVKISFIVKIQRYFNKDEGHTRTFYGGIYMPFFPFLICQALLILGEKIDSELNHEPGSRKSDKVNLQKYCDSWHITVRKYYGLYHIVKDKILHMQNIKRKDVKEALQNIYYSLI